VVADRLAYNSNSKLGGVVQGEGELLADLDNGKVKLESIARKDLPTELQTLNDTELKETIVKKQQERNEILGRVNQLNQNAKCISRTRPLRRRKPTHSTKRCSLPSVPRPRRRGSNIDRSWA
jgi:hypothetical protein